ncbi:MAG: DNA recombination/repair protein RecA, partial [bacterium]
MAIKLETKSTPLDDAISAIHKSYGEGAIMRLGDARQMDVEVIPTGSLNLDIALGVGGVPRGRVIEIFGPESSGKTTLALHIVAEAQKKGDVAAFVDAEHALDPEYARRIGVNTKELLISQPDTGEQALDIVEALIRSNAVGVIVIDSVA